MLPPVHPKSGGRFIKKEMADLPLDVQEQIRGLEALPDEQIDTTDAPEILDWSDARRGVFYRPVKHSVGLRTDRELNNDISGVMYDVH